MISATKKKLWTPVKDLIRSYRENQTKKICWSYISFSSKKFVNQSSFPNNRLQVPRRKFTYQIKQAPNNQLKTV